MKNKLLCSCGFGGGGGGSNHTISENGCCRKEAFGNLIPTNFRKERLFQSWPEDGFNVCDIDGETITMTTLIQQRGYHSHDNDRWSLPKDEESIDSLSSI